MVAPGIGQAKGRTTANNDALQGQHLERHAPCYLHTRRGVSMFNRRLLYINFFPKFKSLIFNTTTTRTVIVYQDI